MRNANHALAEKHNCTPEAQVELIGKVSEPLRVEVHFETYSPILISHPFFKKYCEDCPHIGRQICHSAMSAIVVASGDVIFNAGETPTRPKMYIVNRGRFAYYTSGATERILTTGMWVSEANLWTTWKHRGVLSASQEGLLYVLDAIEFQQIVARFEVDRFSPHGYAREFVDNINRSPTKVTDIDEEAFIRTHLVSVHEDGD